MPMAAYRELHYSPCLTESCTPRYVSGHPLYLTAEPSLSHCVFLAKQSRQAESCGEGREGTPQHALPARVVVCCSVTDDEMSSGYQSADDLSLWPVLQTPTLIYTRQHAHLALGSAIQITHIMHSLGFWLKLLWRYLSQHRGHDAFGLRLQNAW